MTESSQGASERSRTSSPRTSASSLLSPQWPNPASWGISALALGTTASSRTKSRHRPTAEGSNQSCLGVERFGPDGGSEGRNNLLLLLLRHSDEDPSWRGRVQMARANAAPPEAVRTPRKAGGRTSGPQAAKSVRRGFGPIPAPGGSKPTQRPRGAPVRQSHQRAGERRGTRGRGTKNGNPPTSPEKALAHQRQACSFATGHLSGVGVHEKPPLTPTCPRQESNPQPGG